MNVQRTLSLGLCVLSIGLGVTIALEMSGLGHDVARYPKIVQLPVTTTPHQVNLARSTDQHPAWLSQALARPLFSPDRRPINVDVRGLPRLTGIVVAGSQQIAIFSVSSSQRPIIAKPGSHVGVYEVQVINDAGVTISGPEGTTLIRPIFDPSRPAPSSPALLPTQPAKPGTR